MLKHDQESFAAELQVEKEKKKSLSLVPCVRCAAARMYGGLQNAFLWSWTWLRNLYTFSWPL